MPPVAFLKSKLSEWGLLSFLWPNSYLACFYLLNVFEYTLTYKLDIVRKKVLQKTHLLEQDYTVEVYNMLVWNVMAQAMLTVDPPMLELVKVAQFL